MTKEILEAFGKAIYDVNKDYNLLTDEEVEGLLKELKEIYDEMFD